MEKNELGSNSKLETRNAELILGLIGSPCKLGNCEVFVKESILFNFGRPRTKADKDAITDYRAMPRMLRMHHGSCVPIKTTWSSCSGRSSQMQLLHHQFIFLGSQYV